MEENKKKTLECLDECLKLLDKLILLMVLEDDIQRRLDVAMSMEEDINTISKLISFLVNLDS